MVKFALRPLSLHYKVHVLTEEELNRPRNRVKFTGELKKNIVNLNTILIIGIDFSVYLFYLFYLPLFEFLFYLILTFSV